MKLAFPGFMILLTMVGGCKDPRVDALQSKVDELEKTNISTKALADSLKIRLDVAEGTIDNNDRPRGASFDPSEHGYSPIYTAYGVFLVSLRDVQPYANGYKATFQFGNPLNLTFSGFEVTVRWGPKRPPKMHPLQWIDWKKEFAQSTQRLTNVLKPGSWNSVEVVLAPATPENIGTIEISDIITDTVRLSSR